MRGCPSGSAVAGRGTNQKNQSQKALVFGGDSGARTHDLSRVRRTLSRLSYVSLWTFCSFEGHRIGIAPAPHPRYAAPRRIPRYAAPCRIRDTQPRGASRDTASDFRRRRGTACSGEKDRAHTRVRALSGGDGGIRTLDLCVANASLSQLSYAPVQADIHKCKYDFIRVVLTCQGLSKKASSPFSAAQGRGKPCKKGASLPPPISAVRLRLPPHAPRTSFTPHPAPASPSAL